MKWKAYHTFEELSDLQRQQNMLLSAEDRLEKARKINESLWPEIFNEENYNKKTIKLKWIPK